MRFLFELIAKRKHCNLYVIICLRAEYGRRKMPLDRSENARKILDI